MSFCCKNQEEIKQNKKEQKTKTMKILQAESLKKKTLLKRPVVVICIRKPVLVHLLLSGMKSSCSQGEKTRLKGGEGRMGPSHSSP